MEDIHRSHCLTSARYVLDVHCSTAVVVSEFIKLCTASALVVLEVRYSGKHQGAAHSLFYNSMLIDPVHVFFPEGDMLRLVGKPGAVMSVTHVSFTCRIAFMCRLCLAS